MQETKEIILIISDFGGSPSNDLLESISKKINGTTVDLSRHRYSLQWKRRTYDEYKESLYNVLNNTSSPIIVYGCHIGGNVDDSVRIKMYMELVDIATEIYILIPTNLQLSISRVIRRSIARAKAARSSSYLETPMGIAKMIISHMSGYDRGIEMLNEITNHVKEYYISKLKFVGDMDELLTEYT